MHSFSVYKLSILETCVFTLARKQRIMAKWWWGCSLIVVFALALSCAEARLVPGAADVTGDGSVSKEHTVPVQAGASRAMGAGDAKNFIAFGGVGGAAGVGGVAGMGGGLLPGLGGGIGKYGGIGGGAGIGGISGVIPVGGAGGLPGVLPGGLPGGNPMIPFPGSRGGGSSSGTGTGTGTGSGGLPLP